MDSYPLLFKLEMRGFYISGCYFDQKMFQVLQSYSCLLLIMVGKVMGLKLSQSCCKLDEGALMPLALAGHPL